MSKLLISYDSAWAGGTVTASSEHPSFPATNTQHRWFKKPYRSKYGDGSGWGLFRVGATNNTIKFLESGGEKVTDGGMEAWTTPTDLTNWAEAIAGTSTINQDTIEMHGGMSSCRFDVDALNSSIQLYQDITLVAGALHRITIWHKIPIGKTGMYRIRDSASNVWIQSDGTWAAVTTDIELAGTGAWTKYELYFSAHASYTAYRLSLWRLSAASSSLYFDDVSIQAVLTATLTSGDYDADTLATEIGTQMSAIGTTYTATYDDATNKFTIAAPAIDFCLLFSRTTNAAWGMLGWTTTTDSAWGITFTATYIRIHTGELIYLDAGATSTIKAIFIKGHNLQSSATIEVRYYSDAFVTEVDSETLTWHIGQIAARTAKSYRYAAVYIEDIDNPDGFIEIGLVWMGNAYQLHYGFTMERALTPNDPSIISSSEDGQESTIQLSRFDEWGYTFDAVEPNTDRPLLQNIFEEIGTSRPCFICEAPPTLGDIGEDAEYVRLTEWEWTHIAGNYWGLELTVRSER